MYGSEPSYFTFWWIIPIAMMILCFFIMRGRRGAMMNGFGCCSRDSQQANGTESSMEILDRRYASGDIEKAEYEEKKRTLAGPVNPEQSE
ncbi:MAG: SHOCT domain-containing protein [Desulfobacteraceae bacterium]|jgi:uncharacterized membrane protein